MSYPQENIWAVIPVKPLAESKSRLAYVLSAPQRARLIGRFLRRCLETLAQVTSIGKIMVISSDPVALDIAGQYGALAVVEDRPAGLNTAVTTAAHMATEAGAAGILVLPADLPFIRAADVKVMVEAADRLNTAVNRVYRPEVDESRQPVLALCSDNKNEGTNALLLCPPVPFTFRYGPGSLRRHVEEAARRHIVYQIVSAPGLQFDLDTEDDWLIYQSRRQLHPCLNLCEMY